MKQSPAGAPTLMRCAIYTRKSTDENLDSDFNSLDAQRESAEAYIKSQAHEGWQALAQRYDDAGFTGGNMERPALRRLLADIAAGQIDLVICYKVDRLSRSLLDFARMMECFDQQGVSFVSVTQQFNSTQSMGRLTLNILLSFAQFEREIISERTRDKMAAARRKGKWSGGAPSLGYDVDVRTKKLIVHAAEAEQVRAIFALYLQHSALLPVVQELERRGWTTKAWVTRKGRTRGGKRFTKSNLYELLTNVLYAGQVCYRGENYGGEQPALVDPATWQAVQELLHANGKAAREAQRAPSEALLGGLLHCRPCQRSMTPAHTSKRGRRYRYYTCTSAQKRGWQVCPSKSIPAHTLERFVIAQIERLPTQGDLWAATSAGLDEAAQQRARTAIGALGTNASSSECWRIIHALVQRVDYDGGTGTLAVHYRADGLHKLLNQSNSFPDEIYQ